MSHRDAGNTLIDRVTRVGLAKPEPDGLGFSKPGDGNNIDIVVLIFGNWRHFLAGAQIGNLRAELRIQHLLRDALDRLTENQERKLVLNFENVRFMSSAFLGLLVKVHKRVVELDGHLQLLNLDPKIQKVFEITQLTKIFDIA
ncbi:MAG: STAS domain-containing protein [Acidobacteria bacterium]|nr:STAS domain-containing protein [Candidatus Sulfomarinibacter kjeldsenii]